MELFKRKIDYSRAKEKAAPFDGKECILHYLGYGWELGKIVIDGWQLSVMVRKGIVSEGWRTKATCSVDAGDTGSFEFMVRNLALPSDWTPAPVFIAQGQYWEKVVEGAACG